MPPDQGIKDTCYYFEEVSPWWNSSDIMITGPKATGEATRPPSGSTINTVRVNVRRKGAAGDPSCFDPIASGESDFLQVDLWVCVPSSSPFGPTTSAIVKPIRHFVPALPPAPPGTGTYSNITLGSGGSPHLDKLPAAGSSSAVVVNWNLPENPTAPHAAEADGHKCLIARVYAPPYDSPTAGSIHSSSPHINLVEDDQHYAQRNICINLCSSPCGVDIVMVNEDTEAPRTFQLRAVQDLKPTLALRAVIEHALRQAELPDYRLADRPPAKGFDLIIRDMPNVPFVRDQPPDLSPAPINEAGCLTLLRRLLGRRITANDAPSRLARIRQQQLQVLPIANLTPSYEGRVTQAPGQLTPYTFQTDLEGEMPGTVHVFHVMEIEAGVVQGGVTLLMVKQ